MGLLKFGFLLREVIVLEYIIYMDESAKEGRYYGNFYGRALVCSTDFKYVVDQITLKKNELNLFNEVKWQCVTTNYLDKYIALIDLFFILSSRIL
ncbi:hypothetical protein skT53_24890 [Effusibacillus dendaii]|uniref:DUF3800 domain-containing protein n=1 Tax=Effusibacillus dendaii TaxID=2743772 RepID=A0A7I8DBP6_9BACL|nr:hypothetical protein skT53_24890 [Effusibacillus dendaii]